MKGDQYWFSKVAVIIASIVVVADSGGMMMHIVGDSIWSIPPINDFYNKWSSSRVFHAGDVLYFEFESEMYDVIRILNRYEYDDCDRGVIYPDLIFNEGPASITLEKDGEFYYISSILNYCSLGLKLKIHVNNSHPR